MNYRENHLRLNLAGLISMFLLVIISSCNQSNSNNKSQDELTVAKDTLYIHNDANPGRLHWSFYIDAKKTYPLQKGIEMNMKIEYNGEYSQIQNKISTFISSSDSNCTITKINNHTFKVLINESFTSKILTLKVEASPNERTTIINTQHDETYDYPAKFFMSELNNEISEK